MDLGLLYEFDVPQPWDGEHPWGQRVAERRVYKENLEQIAFADKLGFDTVSNEVVLGALSQITSKIKLGFGVSLMPHEFIHPARVAEKVATVDLLSGGRVQWGIGRSTPMEQLAFGVDIPRSKDKMCAAARSVVGMWASDYYEEHSEFLDFPKRMVTPKPWQDPHPPVWMATASESSAVMAGENGCGLLCFSIMQPLSKLQPLIEKYRAAQLRAKPLTSVQTNKVGIYTLVHCAESRDKFEENRLWESMWWWYKGIAEFHLKWEMAHLTPEQQAQAFPLLEKQARGDFDITQFDKEDMVIIGTPDECLEKFLKYDALGVDQLLCYLNFGYLPQEAVMKCIELLGTFVIPELAKRGANRSAAALSGAIRSAEAASS
jgi:alkanesulfonate monooxygenase SsuD/methylene tetrahydromethanopterin reductase-like flavin-dependent oxidoreductase (luciferase family)